MTEGFKVFLVFLGVAIFAWVVVATVPDTAAERKRAWNEFETSLKRQGCKVTGFVSQRNERPRAVWTCPDGHAELGRPESAQ